MFLQSPEIAALMLDVAMVSGEKINASADTEPASARVRRGIVNLLNPHIDGGHPIVMFDHVLGKLWGEYPDIRLLDQRTGMKITAFFLTKKEDWRCDNDIKIQALQSAWNEYMKLREVK
jgi:hypothetical protein